MVWRMAWRNAWRNPRRTGIVVTAVAVGITGVLLSMGLNYGMVFQMVETAISGGLGHVQVHGAGWDASPELGVTLPDAGRGVVAAVEAQAGVRAFARRARGEGLLSSPRASAGVRVVGIEPERESRISTVARSITEGRYLDGTRRRAVIGEELARRLGVGVGDKVVLAVQELSGDLAAEALRVSGLFRSASRELERGHVFVSLPQAQKLLGLGDVISEVVVLAERREDIAPLRDALRAALPGAEVRSWDELQPILVYMIDLFDQSAIYVYAAVFVAMAFGIANVLLMAVYERIREIGILMAVGMRGRRLVAVIVAESALVTLLGLGVGFAATLAGIALIGDGIDLSAFSEGLNAYGIPTRIAPVLRRADFLMPTGVAVVTAVLSSAWPALHAVRFRPADAVRRV